MPGGVDSVIHCVREEVLEKEMCVLTIDAKNAFNCPQRPAIAAALLNSDVFLPFRAVFDLEYGTPGDLLFRHTKLASCCGVRQGSTLGPLFFCAVLHPLLKELALLTILLETKWFVVPA